jgi:hypothetical protein
MHFFEVLGAKNRRFWVKIDRFKDFFHIFGEKKKKKKKKLSFSNAIFPKFYNKHQFLMQFSFIFQQKNQFSTNFSPIFRQKYQFLTDFSTKIINFECIFFFRSHFKKIAENGPWSKILNEALRLFVFNFFAHFLLFFAIFFPVFCYFLSRKCRFSVNFIAHFSLFFFSNFFNFNPKIHKIIKFSYEKYQFYYEKHRIYYEKCRIYCEKTQL